MFYYDTGIYNGSFFPRLIFGSKYFLLFFPSQSTTNHFYINKIVHRLSSVLRWRLTGSCLSSDLLCPFIYKTSTWSFEYSSFLIVSRDSTQFIWIRRALSSRFISTFRLTATRTRSIVPRDWGPGTRSGVGTGQSLTRRVVLHSTPANSKYRSRGGGQSSRRRNRRVSWCLG